MGLLRASLQGDESTFPYLELVLAFNTLVFFWSKYLDVRQLKALRLPSPPSSLKDVYEEKEYVKTQAYQLDKWWSGQVSSTFSFILNTTLLAIGYLPWLWAKSSALYSALGFDSTNEIGVTIVFFLLDSAKDMVVGLPWSLYSAFVLEQKHGFNRQTLGLFFVDKLKEIGLGLVLGPPVVAGFTWILLHTGPYVALYLWAFLLVLTAFFMTVYPSVIAPLFNKFDPLQEGSLRSAIEALAGSLQFPLTKLYVIDGSKRSAHSNAYMYGFWKNKRIVLFDTLLQQCSEDEVVAVLAHELGHWKLNHTLKNLVVGQFNILANFSLFTLVRASKPLFRSFGFSVQPAFVAFILFNYICGPLDEVVSLLGNVLSRRFEFQADAFAVDLGRATDLRGALLKLDRENRSACNVDPWYSAYHYSHPPLVERLKAIDASDKKEQ